jgi:hypothetical protein
MSVMHRQAQSQRALCGDGQEALAIVLAVTNRSRTLIPPFRVEATIFANASDQGERCKLIRHFLENPNGCVRHCLSEAEMRCLAETLCGWSGSDIEVPR